MTAVAVHPRMLHQPDTLNLPMTFGYRQQASADDSEGKECKRKTARDRTQRFGGLGAARASVAHTRAGNVSIARRAALFNASGLTELTTPSRTRCCRSSGLSKLSKCIAAVFGSAVRRAPRFIPFPRNSATCAGITRHAGIENART